MTSENFPRAWGPVRRVRTPGAGASDWRRLAITCGFLLSLAGCENGGVILGTSAPLKPAAQPSSDPVDAGATLKGGIGNVPDAACSPASDANPCEGSGDLQSSAASCGNGIVEAGEECDEKTPTCTAACHRQPGCGDGKLQDGEECDDGNLVAGDGCDSLCRRETCGNGRVDAKEQCDDGNTASGDGCSATCLKEVCGDGIVNQLPGVEQCELPGTGDCDTTCHPIVCGNGIVQGTEECDDGNTAAGDGCSPDCHKEACGNGRLDPNEDCEPPNTDKCDAQCHARHAECGNGVLEVGEECDDGNLAYGDGCSPTCQKEQCGDGRVEAPAEECDPPGTATCDTECHAPCGNGLVEAVAGEECDDGNRNNGDGCSSTCQRESCGNGRIDPPEQCEPPGTSTCDASCRAIGDGTQGVQIPLGAAPFQLINGDFDGSSSGWQTPSGAGASVSYNPIDADGNDGLSGSIEVSVQGTGTTAAALSLALVIGDPTLGNGAIGQCVKTAAGATYQLTVSAELMGGTADLATIQLGARFYAGNSCTGRVVDGVSTENELDANADWDTLTLPPSSVDPTFAVPDNAGSMLVWMQVEQDVDSASVLFDDIQLIRGSSPVCGDGIPEGDEECEPAVTPGCSNDCKLPVVCGDGLAAPSECGPNAAKPCPADCPKQPPVCGDGTVTPPEECDPPGTGQCSVNCTTIRGNCGDGKVDPTAGERCDPPNGATCDAQCHTMKCGDGTVQPPEQCDPPGAGCSEHCRKLDQLPSTCGDGILQGDEECDPPNPDTWCSLQCKRRNPALACGDGVVDQDLKEECDPPSYANNCGSDCRRPVCGDGKVSGAEQCDPPDNSTCGPDCRFIVGGATDCQACLADTCSGPAPAPDLFSACYGLDGVAQAGPGKGAALRQLCADAVACMAGTGCGVEIVNGAQPNPVSCYCGKQVLQPNSQLAASGQPKTYLDVLSECRDGVTDATGPCRAAFERAAEGDLPGSVLAAMDPTYGRPALTAAIRLMTQCGQATVSDQTPRSCSARCAPKKTCGDGIVGPGEVCDPNDPEWGENGSRWTTEAHPHCDPTYCTVLPCGNGKVDTVWPYDTDKDPTLPPKPDNWLPETCDVADPFTSKTCDPFCHLITTCGDGILTPSVEACDPGPKGNWDHCCHPGDTSATKQAGVLYPDGLLGCDKDKNGTIDPSEGCQLPSICGNGTREGTEECDDPTDTAHAHCDENCKIVRTSPCDLCTQLNCVGQLNDCYHNTDLSTASACIEVYECYVNTKCETPDVGLQSCLCGTTEGLTCSSAGGNGACADKIAKYSSCGDQPAPACVYTKQSNPGTPAGLANQLRQCQEDSCPVECLGWQ